MKEKSITRDAEADLLECWIYLAERSEQAAARIKITIETQIEQLVEFPGMGRRRDALSKGLRSLPVENYVLFYFVTETTVTISRVLHGSAT